MQEIRQVVVDSCRGWDRQDRELVQACYHPDAVEDRGFYQGPALEFYDATTELRAGVRASHHNLGQTHVVLDGDRAAAETYCIATSVFDGADGPQTRVRAVRYLDRLERRDGAWKIVHRFAVFDAETTVPGGSPTGVPDANLGTRDRDDPSNALFG
jgi:SnoaL-like protein